MTRKRKIPPGVGAPDGKEVKPSRKDLCSSIVAESRTNYKEENKNGNQEE